MCLARTSNALSSVFRRSSRLRTKISKSPAGNCHLQDVEQRISNRYYSLSDTRNTDAKTSYRMTTRFYMKIIKYIKFRLIHSPIVRHRLYLSLRVLSATCAYLRVVRISLRRNSSLTSLRSQPLATKIVATVCLLKTWSPPAFSIPAVFL